MIGGHFIFFMRQILIIWLLLYPVLLTVKAESIDKMEKNLQSLYGNLYHAPTDSLRNLFNDSIRLQLKKALSEPTSFKYAFDSLPFLGKIYSTDHALRIYSWNYISEAGEYRFFSFIQRQVDNKILTLIQNRVPYLPDDKILIENRDWYGALYYQAIPYLYQKQIYYLLLGWSHYTSAVNFKIIDILSIHDDKIVFGLPVFYRATEYFSRVVLPYSSRYSLSLQYDFNRKLLYFNHLNVIQNSDVQFPDETFSAYLFTKNGLKYQEEITLQSDQHEEKQARTKLELGPEK
jgi:hypothetical protein